MSLLCGVWEHSRHPPLGILEGCNGSTTGCLEDLEAASLMSLLGQSSAGLLGRAPTGELPMACASSQHGGLRRIEPCCLEAHSSRVMFQQTWPKLNCRVCPSLSNHKMLLLLQSIGHNSHMPARFKVALLKNRWDGRYCSHIGVDRKGE
jgi:hypothetical protein